ncbi:hypothetical protein VNI00_003477 [Paramarasmius palmivorus]|uniref:Uncharacterized protein n=1 Tax=Paramarasmius palmivorus TaxID=297713 RepID=A0AAW0DSS9_9AGAR
MAPFAFAVSPVFLVVLASVAFFALSGLALFRMRTSMAASRPVDVEAAITQLQTRLVPVVGRLGFDGHQMALRDTLGHLIRVRAGVDPNTGSEGMRLARPESLFIEQPPKAVQLSESNLIASSSFEAWASSLCDLIDGFTGIDRSPKASSSFSEPGLVPSSSFEFWAATLCDLISEFASPAPFRYTPLDTFEEDPFIFDTMYKTPVIPDIMVTPPSPRIEEDIYQQPSELSLVASPSFMDLAAECAEEFDGDDVEPSVVIEANEDTSITFAHKLLHELAQHNKDEPTLSLSFRYGSTLSTEIQTDASRLDSEERINDDTQHKQSRTSRYLSPSPAISLPFAVEEHIEECESEETLKSVFESDSEDDETYYSRRPHLSRPKRPSQSMSSMLRNIVEKRNKAQQSRRTESKTDKENVKKHSGTTSKRRFFSKTLATPSEPCKPVTVPTIRFTPPTPPRRFMKENRENLDEDVGLDLEMGMGTDEVVERIAFDLVVDDYGRCFF